MTQKMVEWESDRDVKEGCVNNALEISEDIAMFDTKTKEEMDYEKEEDNGENPRLP